VLGSITGQLQDPAVLNIFLHELIRIAVASNKNGKGCEGVKCSSIHSEALEFGESDVIRPYAQNQYFLYYLPISVFSNKLVISNN
jgi:hypothetical protein